MPEPSIVVGNREHLWYLLSEAAQLEHMIMCQYLFAEFSLKQGTAEGLTVAQTEAVERWRKTLRGIVVEEMLHLALVSNLMSAIGAAPSMSRPNFPQRSGYFPAGLQLDLLPFGERALRHFLYLERPEGMELQDAEGFVPVAPPLSPQRADDPLPHGQEFSTVGHLYRGIADGLRSLVDRLGEPAVFVGSPRAQATPEMMQWPQVIPVTDLESALAAVEEIIEQGEGARGDWRDAHYGRFLGIWEEFQELRRADPGFEPAHPVMPAYLTQPFDLHDPVQVVTDPRTREITGLADLAYEVMLHLLTRFFTHSDETDEQLTTLIDGVISIMAGALRPLATAMGRLPVGAAHPGRTAGYTFQMYYVMTNLAPWREPAWALLYERLSLLAQRCGAAAGSPDMPEVVGQVGERAASVADRIKAHVPARLLPRDAVVAT